jgi:hypothetical protein
MNCLGEGPSTPLRIADGKFLKRKNNEHLSLALARALGINKIQ